MNSRLGGTLWTFAQDDAPVFTNGGSYVWRNGDTFDPATDVKCMQETGGISVGTPGDAAVQSLVFAYIDLGGGVD